MVVSSLFPSGSVEISPHLPGLKLVHRSQGCWRCLSTGNPHPCAMVMVLVEHQRLKWWFYWWISKMGGPRNLSSFVVFIGSWDGIQSRSSTWAFIPNYRDAASIELFNCNKKTQMLWRKRKGNMDSMDQAPSNSAVRIKITANSHQFSMCSPKLTTTNTTKKTQDYCIKK